VIVIAAFRAEMDAVKPVSRAAVAMIKLGTYETLFFTQPVGCDLKLGSPKKVDECGICGGDGTSCTTPMYRWAIVATGVCSASCGGGKFIGHLQLISAE